MLEHLCGYQEINHLDKDEQEQLIQEAKYEAYTTLGLSSTATFYLVLSIVIAAMSIKIMSDTLPTPLPSAMGIASFILSYHLLSKSLIARGLRSILAKQRISK